MNNLQAVIFDMDGVIIDSEPIYFKIQNKIYSQLGISITPSEYDEFIGAGMHLMWQILKRNKNLNQSIEELIAMNNYIVYKSFKEMTHLSPMPNFIDFIDKCDNKKLKIALASSTAKRTINAILDNLNIHHYFDEIVSCEEVKLGKPAPDIFLAAAQRLNVNPENCIVIEDSTNGIKAAKDAGMYCIALRNENYANQDLSIANIVLNNFNQINQHVFK
jgi:beta-phosphoglucomutase family hydrolase